MCLYSLWSSCLQYLSLFSLLTLDYSSVFWQVLCFLSIKPFPTFPPHIALIATYKKTNQVLSIRKKTSQNPLGKRINFCISKFFACKLRGMGLDQQSSNFSTDQNHVEILLKHN